MRTTTTVEARRPVPAPPSRRTPSPSAGRHAALLGLQRSAGNAAVNGLVSRPVQRDDVSLGVAGLTGPGREQDASELQASGGSGGGSGTRFVMGAPVAHRVNGTTPQEIEQRMSGLIAAGHVEVELDWSAETDASGRVTSATVTVTMTKHTYSWGSGRGRATTADRAIIDEFFRLINAHEERHIARNRAAFTGLPARLVGRTGPQAQAAVTAAECAAGRSDEALDAAEGCVRFTTNHQGAELVGLAACGHPDADYTSHLSCPAR